MLDKMDLEILGSLNENGSMGIRVLMKNIYGTYRRGSYPGTAKRLNRMSDRKLVEIGPNHNYIRITPKGIDEYLGKKE